VEAVSGRIAIKKAHRQEREAELRNAQAAGRLAMNGKRYGVLYADPPWRFEPRSRETGMDRAADNHYPTMTLEQIKALAVPAAKDCVLFLWATAAMLPEAHKVMEAWDFTYKSRYIWVKDRISTGYWVRDQAEELLVGTRGKIPAPAPGQQYASVVRAAVGEHSAKPAIFREMIETMFPHLPRIELFARQAHEGWDRWGLDAPHAASGGSSPPIAVPPSS
jgi:N6-adenosine-specific RNA methylase IME4